MSIQVFAFIIALALMLGQGCSDDTLKPEDEIKTGDIVQPPWGCIELRGRQGEC